MSTDDALTLLDAADEHLARGDLAAAHAARERAHELLAASGATTAVLDGDAETWVFGHELPGPAGSASLRLSGGGMLTVDAADPSRVLGLSIPALDGDGDAAHAVAGALVRDEAAALMRPGAEPDVATLVAFDPRSGPVGSLARLAALDHARRIDEAANGAWPIWAAEAAVLCARASEVPGFDVRARAEAASCAAAVEAVAESLGAGGAHARLAELLPELTPLAASDVDRARLSAQRACCAPSLRRHRRLRPTYAASSRGSPASRLGASRSSSGSARHAGSRHRGSRGSARPRSRSASTPSHTGSRDAARA